MFPKNLWLFNFLCLVSSVCHAVSAFVNIWKMNTDKMRGFLISIFGLHTLQLPYFTWILHFEVQLIVVVIAKVNNKHFQVLEIDVYVDSKYTLGEGEGGAEVSVFSFPGDCNGTKESEKITETQSRYLHVVPGSRVVITWKWCVAINSSITGVVIYRVTRVNSRVVTNQVVLSMDLLKKIYYLKDNSRHELSSIVNQTSFQEIAVFIIHNVSKVDSGEYSLHVRRLGYSDLHNEIKIIVITGDPTNGIPSTAFGKHTTKLVSTNDRKEDLQSSVRKDKAKGIGIVPMVIVIFAVLLVCLAVLAVLLKLRMSGGQACRGCFRSNERRFNGVSDDPSYATLVKAEF